MQAEETETRGGQMTDPERAQQLALAQMQLDQFAKGLARMEALRAQLEGAEEAGWREPRLRQWALIREDLEAARAALEQDLARLKEGLDAPEAGGEEEAPGGFGRETKILRIAEDGAWILTEPDLEWAVGPEHRDYALTLREGQALRWSIGGVDHEGPLVNLEDPESFDFATVRPDWSPPDGG
ncbi:MAG: hypothetical protein M5U26_20920 [Planctomycetota bacterium]|nr:hypothetical protein [Planctomycetota bacterium]